MSQNEDAAKDPADPLRANRAGLYAPVPHTETAYHLWRQFDPALADTLSKFFVGGLYQREVLTQREREFCAVAALTVMRAKDELRLQVLRDALKERGEWSAEADAPAAPEAR